MRRIEMVDPIKHQIHWILNGFGVINDPTTTCTGSRRRLKLAIV